MSFKGMFAQEFHNILSLASELMNQKDVLSIEDFAKMTDLSYKTIFPKEDIDRKRLFNELPGYYMVYLAKNWLENAASPPKRQYPANKSSERPYLKLVR